MVYRFQEGIKNDAEKNKKIYCPYCRKYGRDKLLFQADKTTTGKVIIKCRGCRNLVTIELVKGEPKEP